MSDYPNSHEKLTKSEIMPSWIMFESCSESLFLVHRKSYMVVISNPYEVIYSHNHSSDPYKVMSDYPNSHEKLTKSEIMPSWIMFERCSESLF